MAETSSVSPLPPVARGWRRTRALLPVFAVVLLTLYLFQPAVAVMDATLDNSNFASYAYFTAHHAQYGTDVISMVGPYGFAHYGWIYSGYLFEVRLLLDLLIKGALAALIVWWLRQPGPWTWRVLWFLTALGFTKLNDDMPFTVCILLSGLYLILRFDRPGRVLPHCLLAGLLALLTLAKGTETILVLATFGLAGILALVVRRWGRLGWIALSYVLSYVTLWLVAGQKLLHIPAFLRGIRELSIGYNGALSLQEAPPITINGLIILVSLLGAAGVTAWLNRRDIPRLLAVALITGFSLVAWKHGYVRADGHVFLFFQFALFASLMIPMVLTPGATGWLRRTQTGLALCAFFAAAFGASDGGNVLGGLRQLPAMLPSNIAHLLKFREAKAQLEEKLDFQRTAFNLLEVRKAVTKGASVDLFGFEHGYIPLNQLNYHPRPMGGGAFNVYTPYLMQRNADFILNPKTRPDYYLVKIQSVDERLIAQDDALALRAIVNNYEPRLMEKGLLLLQARTGPVTNPAPHVLSTVEFTLGETVHVPAVGPDEILLLSMDFQPTWLGRLRSLVYKPAHLYMDLDGDDIGQRIQRRIVPSMISQPVIFCPLLEDDADVLELYGRRTGKTATGFRINAEPAGGFRTRARATFYTIPRPPKPTTPDGEDVVNFAHAHLWNATPDLIPPSTRNYGGVMVVFLHAPGELPFTLKGNERELSFEYGIDPAAETQPAGDGVIFLVEIEGPNHARQEIFRHYLRPMIEESDRGNHIATVKLPLMAPGSRLIIRTDPGPTHNNAWDWSYVSHVQIRRGVYSLEQFPGFDVTPVRVEAQNAGAADIEGRNLFMLNAPGFVEFALRGHEQVLEFSGGILPGAYTGKDGATDGVGFIVELRHTDGHMERLFYRYVRPLIVPEDRGDQNFTVKLPYAARGTHLIIMIDGGPKGDISWDWSYLSRVRLH